MGSPTLKRWMRTVPLAASYSVNSCWNPRFGELRPAVEEPLDEGNADIPERDGSIGLDDAPEVRRLRALLSEDHSDEEFEVSLEVLLDRFAGELSQ